MTVNSPGVATDDLDGWYDRCANAASGVISEVLRHLPAGGLLVDVGANVGAVTGAALEHGARVWAFEPHAVYARYCEQRHPDAVVIASALGDRDAPMTLYSDRHGNPGWNTFVGAKITAQMSTSLVQMRTLDSFDLRPDVLKIDTEGYEHHVIKGGWDTIRRHRPVIVMELGWGREHPEHAERHVWLENLHSIGYNLVDDDLDGTSDVVLVA